MSESTTNPGGRPREGDLPRVSRTVSIDEATSENIDHYISLMRTSHPNMSPGRIIDRMAIFCRLHRFNPASKRFETYRPQHLGPAQVTTPTPASATSAKA